MWSLLVNNPFARWVAGVTGVLFVALLTFLKIRADGYEDGKSDTLEKIEHAEEKQSEKARDARDDMRVKSDDERVRYAEDDPNNRLRVP